MSQTIWDKKQGPSKSQVAAEITTEIAAETVCDAEPEIFSQSPPFNGKNVTHDTVHNNTENTTRTGTDVYIENDRVGDLPPSPPYNCDPSQINFGPYDDTNMSSEISQSVDPIWKTFMTNNDYDDALSATAAELQYEKLPCLALVNGLSGGRKGEKVMRILKRHSIPAFDLMQLAKNELYFDAFVQALQILYKRMYSIFKYIL